MISALSRRPLLLLPVVGVLLVAGLVVAVRSGDAQRPPPPPAASAQAAEPDCAEAVSDDAPIDRVAGADRYATAACAAAVAYPDGADEVILARGDDAGGLADALAGAVLAHAVDGPVVLTAPTSLPAATRDEIDRLDPSTVTILGGADAVSAGVAEELAATGVAVDRVEGGDRFATAARVAERAGPADTAFVVNGTRPPDSLVAAAPAARAGAKLLLVADGTVPPATAAALDGVDDVVVVGGHGVVGDEVAAELGRLAGTTPRRVAGATRAGTAASVARAYPGDGRVHLARSADAHLVDAVTAGWAAAQPGGGPVVYVERDRPGRAADRWLRLGGLGTADEVRPTRLVGGTAVLGDELVAALESRYAEAAGGGPAPQLRGTWTHLFDDTLKTRAGIHRMLDQAAQAGANTVIVQVARRQDAYYDSDVLPRTPDPALADDLDVLAELVPAAHDRGLAVHAWVSVLQAYHYDAYDGLTLPADHVWRRHGPGSDDSWLMRRADGETGTYLDPGVPAVQDQVAAIMREIAARFDVDAVHTDYLRYSGSGDWGYHPTSLARFRTQTGASGTPPPDSPAWSDWRRRQTADLARRVFLEVVDADPATAVSMAASTMGEGPVSAGGYEHTRTYSWVFQDWPSWLAEGTVDAAVPMNYFREANPEHRGWYDEWLAFEQGLVEAGGLVAVGLGSYLNPLDDSLAQIARAEAAADGVVLYSHQQNVADGPPQALLSRMASSAWAEPAPAPALTDRGGGGAQTGHLLVRASDGVEVVAAPEGGESRSQTADATGHAGLVGLEPGEWTVHADGHGSMTVTVAAGEVTRVELAGGS